MTWIKKQTDGTHDEFNFVPPASADAAEVLFPIGEVQAAEHATTHAVTITQMETFLQPEELEANATINLTIDSQVTKGAKLHLKLDADTSARTVTLGTGFSATPATVVVAATTVAYVSFVYDGTAFLPMYDIPT